MSRRSIYHRVAASSAIAVFLALSTPACINVPVRVSEQGRDVSGKPLDLDLTFLKSGSTTRGELTKKLAVIDTGINQRNFFWGRWDSSKWRTTAIGFVPPEGERIWHAQNLLIQFDPNDIVKDWTVVDDKGLTRQLSLLVQSANSSLDLSSPIQADMRVRQRDDIQAGLVLSSDFFEQWRVTQTNHHFSLKTPRTNLLRIEATPEHSYYGPQSEYIPYTRANLILATIYLAESADVHYGEKSRSVGKKLVLGVDPPTFMLLRRYIEETKQRSK